MPLTSTTTDLPARAYLRSQVRRIVLPGTVPVVEWMVLLALAAYIGGRALPRAWRRLNTDFPNYYITARLWREGYSTNRIYEWIWLQRQKDYMGITRSDQPVVGFVPDTPFSALIASPLTFWSPLVSKRLWIVINLALLVSVAVFLRSITRLEWRRLALLIGLCYPLLRNFEYGQYYLLILLLVTAALWCYLHGRPFVAGALLGVAAGLKIFPALFILYFLRKRDARCVIGLVAGTVLSVLASLAAFGPLLHRVYVAQIIPWALRGEALDPYSLVSNSLSSLLHRLFLFEPEWNPHPLLHAPAAFAVLHPLLQLLVLAPALYFATAPERDSRSLQLEWSTFLVALLAISTLPASYHFTVLILPVAVFAAEYLRTSDYRSVTLLFLLYAAICFPWWPRSFWDGWWAFTAVPRLYFVLLLCGLCYMTLFRRRSTVSPRRVDDFLWAAALALALTLEVASTIHHQRGAYDYRGRITTTTDVCLAAAPLSYDGRVGFIAMRIEGYSAGTVGASRVHLEMNSADQLSQTSNGTTIWIEEASTSPRIIKKSDGKLEAVEVNNAEFPVASSDGRWLAFLRSMKGKGVIWRRSLSEPGLADTRITPQQLDVEEMTFLPDGSLIFSAIKDDQPPTLYIASPGGQVVALDVGEARYPAVSPDGHWLAFSRLEDAVWNLSLRDLRAGTTSRLTSHNCNDVSPAWQADSRTLLYASDCGRALWFTAIYRRRVVP